MKINVQAVNFDAKPGLEEFLVKKLSKLSLISDGIIGAQVFLKEENISEKNNKSVDIRLEVPGDDIIVNKLGESFEESIDLAIDTLRRLLIRKKEKISDR